MVWSVRECDMVWSVSVKREGRGEVMVMKEMRGKGRTKEGRCEEGKRRN
jgi:hypothetical protein